MTLRLLCSLSLLLAACSGSTYGQRSASSGAATTSPASAPGATAADGHAAAGGQTAAPEPERPGLGTVWGEDRVSRVTSRRFIRAASAPFAQVALHYNDAEGVAAHADYRGGVRPAPHTAYTPHGGVSVVLVDDRDNILPGISTGDRTLIVGEEGRSYRIALHNHTAGRYEVVASVDGLDVIDGRPADPSKRGYVLDPHSTVIIDGFRRSDDVVAAFRFGRVSASYAARTSGDRNVGVIGLAFFAERGSPWTSDELHRRDTADPFPGGRSYARPPR